MDQQRSGHVETGNQFNAEGARFMTIKNQARTAGIFYLILAIAGGFSELYVRSAVAVNGDAAATAANVAEHSTLMRFGFLADLVNITAFLVVALLMYSFLKPIHEAAAVGMVAFNAVAVAVMSMNMLNHLGAMLIAGDPVYTAGLSPETSDALAMFLLDMHGHGYGVAQIFFGLWLLPLGYLVLRSGYFPKALGVMLMIGSGGYLLDVITSLVSPTLGPTLSPYLAMPSGFAELLFLLWLIVKGASVPKPSEPTGPIVDSSNARTQPQPATST